MIYDKEKEIQSYVVKSLLTGRMKDGDSLPDIRFFTNLFKVNPNIVKDAISLMEEEGLVEKSNDGYKLRASEEKIAHLKELEINKAINDLITSLSPMGISLEDIVATLNMRNIANG